MAMVTITVKVVELHGLVSRLKSVHFVQKTNGALNSINGWPIRKWLTERHLVRVLLCSFSIKFQIDMREKSKHFIHLILQGGVCDKHILKIVGAKLLHKKINNWFKFRKRRIQTMFFEPSIKINIRANRVFDDSALNGICVFCVHVCFFAPTQAFFLSANF